MADEEKRYDEAGAQYEVFGQVVDAEGNPVKGNAKPVELPNELKGDAQDSQPIDVTIREEESGPKRKGK